MEQITLPARLIEQMIEHARSAPHSEVCGLLAARDGRPCRCIAIPNIAAHPETLFRMDPKQQIDAFRSMREQGEQLFAIYHSHPVSEAYPSATDARNAFYPDSTYLICSLERPQRPVIRAYRMTTEDVSGTLKAK